MSARVPIQTASSQVVARVLESRTSHIHLMGIGGAGLSAIARVLLERGYRVSGCDLASNAQTEALSDLGASIAQGHSPEHLTGVDLVLISSAVPADNVELQAAQAAKLPVVKREQFLGHLLRDLTGIAIAGTHGKTTTTAMIATTLLAAGLDPGFIIGGVLPQLGTNARAGAGKVFVIEADEYDRMFLGLAPRIAVVTNVEWDHVDCYPTPEAFAEAFAAFVDRLPPDGLLVACQDDPGARRLAERRRRQGRPVVTYGLDPEADWRACDVGSTEEGGVRGSIWRDGRHVVDLQLRVPGEHNLRNALAALAVSEHLGVQPKIAAVNLNNFAGVERRFQVKGVKYGIIVIDDYAHHPSEVRATLAAARQRYPGRAIWAVFQPHTYTRTRALLAEFAECFGQADHVLVMDIYAARERETLGMHATQVVDRLSRVHPDVQYSGDLPRTVEILRERLEPGDVLITLGAGDGYKVGEQILALGLVSGEVRP